MIADRRAHPNGAGDFMQTLAEARYSDGKRVPVDILESMILFLVFSASERTRPLPAFVAHSTPPAPRLPRPRAGGAGGRRREGGG